MAQYSEPLSKAFLLLLAGLSYNYGFRPPCPPNPKNATTRYDGQHFETMVLIWAFLARISVVILSLLHIAVILSIQFPNSYSPIVVDSICPHPTSSLETLNQLSGYFLVGITITILASLIRAWCYATLGRLFTYKVTVLPNHNLVTSGPYAYVRHPSYTGALLLHSGAAITYLISSGNYLSECGIMATPFKWLVWYWIGAVLFTVISLKNRAAVEDGLMKKTFSSEWVAYREKVRYAFIPYIF
ncbi:hypothetical protein BDQ12DRAFT_692430 [Crucibulum laeve]|uniref:Protein-S-isoprenylcysteine O-methyltransferase n=1 Tax=Crucibulum laeve TaxID=68775 RepID=A0A5C3LHA0_9AGAR|nr:hypothetical protein BDQ12DRAFT_692430 [Crucibulum laeve]